MNVELTRSLNDVTSSMAFQKCSTKRQNDLNHFAAGKRLEHGSARRAAAACWGKIAIKERFKRRNKTIQEYSEMKLHSRQSHARVTQSYCSAINNSTSKNSSGAVFRKNCTKLMPLPPYLIKQILLFEIECNKKCHSSCAPAMF